MNPSGFIGLPLFVSLALLVPLLGACEGGIPSSEGRETISRETFIQTMVDLRMAALRTGDGTISPAARERILGEHGVSAEDLRRFAEVHGRNVPFMHDVWTEVERRISLGEGPGGPGEAPPDPDVLREPGS